MTRTMMRSGASTLLLSLALAVACSEPQATEPDTRLDASTAALVDCRQPDPSGFKSYFDCGTTVRLIGDDVATLDEAADGWAVLAAEAGITFSTTSGSATIRLDLNTVHPGGTVYCGFTSGGTIRLDLENSPGSCNNPGATSLVAVVRHEFGHALGYTEWRYPYSDACVMDLTDYDFSGWPCVEEVETFRYAYGLRADRPSIVDSALVTGVRALRSGTPVSSLALEIGQSVQLTVQSVCQTSTSRCPRGMSYVWSSTAPSVAGVSGTSTATVTAAAAGTATLVLRVTGPSHRMGSPVQNALEGPYSSAGAPQISLEIPVTVAAPPPPASVHSVSLSPSSTYLTVDGTENTQTFTAIALDQNGNVVPDVTFAWSIDDTGVADFLLRGSGPATRRVKAVADGITRVRASAHGFTDSATIHVGCPKYTVCREQ